MMDVTHEDDSVTHWRKMFSLIYDKPSEKNLPTHVVFCGGPSARNRWRPAVLGADDIDNALESMREVGNGFRPVFDSLPSICLPNCLEDGNVITIGTLYMNDKPVKVPVNPIMGGDIESYIPRASLTFGPALDDPAYAVRVIKAGAVYIADRPLLDNISCVDIKKAIAANMEPAETIIVLTPEEVETSGAFEHFYELAARAINYNVTPNTTYDCRRIRVAQNIQDAWYRYYKNRGFDATQVTMNLCLAGAKVDADLADYEVAIETGFFYETVTIRDAVIGILEENDDDKLTAFYDTLRCAIRKSNFTKDDRGRAILKAYAEGEVDALICALASRDMRRLLKQADVLPEGIEIKD